MGTSFQATLGRQHGPSAFTVERLDPVHIGCVCCELVAQCFDFKFWKYGLKAVS